MAVEEFFDKVIMVRMKEGRSALDIIDQALLPGTIKRIRISTKEEIWEVIKKLKVRGAPAIGAATTYGIALLSSRITADRYETFYPEFRELKDYLASSRPTAVDLLWALNRMDRTVAANQEKDVAEIRELLPQEADAIRKEDVQVSRVIEEIDFGLLEELKQEGKEIGIMTHCNAGTLATAKYGTATAPMYIALEKGWPGTAIYVYCDETRPLLQDACLTSFELYNAGIITTLQCDNMTSILMQSEKTDIIFVGCDRAVMNGDSANKIGASGVAILAKHYGIPFYVCAPTSTIDMDTPTGKGIPIEIRSLDEVTQMWYKERMAPEDIHAYNPAFDVTDHSLITGIITEKGMCHTPFDKAFEILGTRKQEEHDMLEVLEEQVVAAAKEVNRLGMCKHKSSNFSIYDPETGYAVITPSGVSRDMFTTKHTYVTDLDGKVVERLEGLKLSSETMMHLYIYKERKDILAIVHTHARYSTALAITNKPTPPIAYESAYLGKTGMVPMAPYGRAGAVDLAWKMADVMKDHEVCLMESHGAITAGNNLEDAFLKTQYVEEIAEMYYITLISTGGAEPKALSVEELEKWAYPKEIIL